MSGPPDWEPAEAPPAPPLQPQPMSIGTVVSVSVKILRRHWAILLLLSLVFVGPGALLSAATGIRFNTVTQDVLPGLFDNLFYGGPAPTEAESERVLAALGPYLLATIVAGVMASLGALGFSVVVGADYFARHIGMSTALRTVLQRTPSVLAFIVITTLIIIAILVAGLVLVVLVTSILSGGIGARGGPGAFVALIIIVGLAVSLAYLTMRWAPAFPAMANESLGWRATMSRCWHLSAENIWRIFLVVLLGTMATVVIGGFLVSPLLALVFVGGGTALGLDADVTQSVSVALGTVLLAPLAPVLIAVLYFDLRIRRDGNVAIPDSPT